MCITIENFKTIWIFALVCFDFSLKKHCFWAIPNRITYRVLENVENAHFDDINSISIKPNGTWSNVFITGSDDALINVYDKRLIGSKGSTHPVGKFFGHNSGITSVDITDCGTYIASNGKDQLIKLWDIRKMLPQSKYEKSERKCIDYDYRNTRFNKSLAFIHEDDSSLFTFKGHTTHVTQIKCSFSPASWTGQRFIASGSFCGCTIIYDTITGEKLGALAPNSKLISKIPIWHPKQRKLFCTSEKKFYIYEYDSTKTSIKSCVGKVNLSYILKKKFNKIFMDKNGSDEQQMNVKKLA